MYYNGNPRISVEQTLISLKCCHFHAKHFMTFRKRIKGYQEVVMVDKLSKLTSCEFDAMIPNTSRYTSETLQAVHDEFDFMMGSIENNI